MVEDSSPVLPDSVWIRRECFAAQKRVAMPWIKSRGLDFTHRITTLIHTLPTLRRGKNVVDESAQLQLLFLYYFSFKKRLDSYLNFALDLSNDWGSHQYHINLFLWLITKLDSATFSQEKRSRS